MRIIFFEKLILLTLLFITLNKNIGPKPHCCVAADRYIPLPRYTMKEIIITKAELNLNKEIDRKFLHKKITVDHMDRVLDETEYNFKGDAIHRITYRYSTFDNISETIEFDASNNLIERQLYSEDENGEITSSTTEYGNGAKTTKKFQFTDLGNADKATLIDENGNVIGYETYILDSDERIVSEFESDENHNELSRIDRKFNDSGEILRETHFSEGEIDEITSNHYRNGQLVKIQRSKNLESIVSTEVREFDSKNRIIKRTTNYHEYSDVEIEFSEYDNNDNVVSNMVEVNGRMIFTNVCKYDKENRLLEEYIMELNLNGSINAHERVFYAYKD